MIGEAQASRLSRSDPAVVNFLMEKNRFLCIIHSKQLGNCRDKPVFKQQTAPAASSGTTESGNFKGRQTGTHWPLGNQVSDNLPRYATQSQTQVAMAECVINIAMHG